MDMTELHMVFERVSGIGVAASAALFSRLAIAMAVFLSLAVALSSFRMWGEGRDHYLVGHMLRAMLVLFLLGAVMAYMERLR